MSSSRSSSVSEQSTKSYVFMSIYHLLHHNFAFQYLSTLS